MDKDASLYRGACPDCQKPVDLEQSVYFLGRRLVEAISYLLHWMFPTNQVDTVMIKEKVSSFL